MRRLQRGALWLHATFAWARTPHRIASAADPQTPQLQWPPRPRLAPSAPAGGASASADPPGAPTRADARGEPKAGGLDGSIESRPGSVGPGREGKATHAPSPTEAPSWRETAQRQHHQAGPASGATSSGEARPGGGKARNLRSTTTKSLVQVPPLEQTFPDYEPLARGPRKYGTWMEQPSQAYVVRPWVLVLFSGRCRKGDLANWLAHYGLIVCSLDLLCDNPCDVLDEAKCMVRDREGHTSAAGQLHLVAPSVR